MNCAKSIVRKEQTWVERGKRVPIDIQRETPKRHAPPRESHINRWPMRWRCQWAAKQASGSDTRPGRAKRCNTTDRNTRAKARHAPKPEFSQRKLDSMTQRPRIRAYHEAGAHGGGAGTFGIIQTCRSPARTNQRTPASPTGQKLGSGSFGTGPVGLLAVRGSLVITAQSGSDRRENLYPTES